MTKTYLGDGVYVRWDDYGNLLLTTEDGRYVTNEIVLDPDVLRGFLRFINARVQPAASASALSPTVE